MIPNLISKSLLALGTLALLATPALAQSGAGRGGPPPESGQGRNAGGPGGRGGGPGGGRGPQDLDGDGKISKEEFLAPAEARFKSQDTDGDGVITLDEILAHVSERFESSDANSDGYLAQEELPSMPGRQGGENLQPPTEE